MAEDGQVLENRGAVSEIIKAPDEISDFYTVLLAGGIAVELSRHEITIREAECGMLSSM